MNLVTLLFPLFTSCAEPKTCDVKKVVHCVFTIVMSEPILTTVFETERWDVEDLWSTSHSHLM